MDQDRVKLGVSERALCGLQVNTWRHTALKQGRRLRVKNVTLGPSRSTPTGWNNALSAPSVAQVTCPGWTTSSPNPNPNPESASLTVHVECSFKDQDVVSPCTHTRDTRCQCKPGRFCRPDQACEVCKKCSRWVLLLDQFKCQTRQLRQQVFWFVWLYCFNVLNGFFTVFTDAYRYSNFISLFSFSLLQGSPQGRQFQKYIKISSVPSKILFSFQF